METYPQLVQNEMAKGNVLLASLIDITLEGGSVLRYTDFETNITVGAATYAKRAFEFGSLPRSSDLSANNITVGFDNIDSALSAAFIANEPRGQDFRISLAFLNGTTGALISTPVLIWSGVTQKCDINEEVATVVAVDYQCRLSREMPCETFDRACPWIFGSTDCAFDETATALAGQTCDAGTTASAIVDAARTEADNYWKDGYVLITSGPATGQKGRVLSSVSGTVTLEHSLDLTPLSTNTYSIHQGCDQTDTTCEDRFNNLSNFRGCINLAGLVSNE